jgi:hypothetical protein
MKRVILLTILITLFATTIVSATPQLQKTDKRAKILIVLLDGKPSWFKQSIIDSLKVTYKTSVIEAKKPGGIKADDYKAVVVMDQLKAWMLGNGKLKKFSKFMDPKHTVYFVTSGDPKWQWKKPGIKAVTSASKSAKVEEVVKKLRLKIEE